MSHYFRNLEVTLVITGDKCIGTTQTYSLGEKRVTWSTEPGIELVNLGANYEAAAPLAEALRAIADRIDPPADVMVPQQRQGGTS